MSTPTYTVKECLHGYTNEALGTICSQWGLASGNKPGRIRAIEKVLLDPLHLRRAVERLDGPALRLAWLIAERGLADTADLLSVPGLYCRQRPEAVLQALAQVGLVLSCPQERAGAFSFAHIARKYQPGETGPILFVPEGVRKLLPPAPPLGIVVPREEAPGAAPVQRKDHGTAVFLETLRIVEAVALRVTATGEIHKSDEARGHELCREAEISPDSMALALMIAREMGCVEERDGRLKTTARAERWAELGRAERSREVFRAFLTSQDLPDLRLFFPEIGPALERHLPPHSLRRTYHRAIVAQLLAEQPEGAWHSFDGLIEAIRVLDRNVLFVEERWRAIDSNAREFNSAWQERAWNAHEKRFYTWMLGTLFTAFGLVEAAEDAGLFRVTPVGRYALGVAPAPEEPVNGCQDALVVQPDFEIIAFLDRCPAGLRRKLDTFCERKRGGPVSTYLLTQESMYRGVCTGVPASEFLGLIERCASKGIPSNVRQQFLTWERKHEAVTVHAACELVECRDEADARALAAELDGARIIGGRYVLADGSAPDVAVRIEYNGARKPCLEPAEGLQLRVPWEKCDLFAPRALARIGELSTDAQGNLVLTLARGKRKRADWDPVLEELESYAGGKLAARYRAALRAWSGESEPAIARSASLVRFADPDMCRAVLEIPEMAELIEGHLGNHVVVVKQGNLTALKKRLKEQGIAVVAGKAIVDEPGPEAPEPPEAVRREEPPAEKAPAGNGHGSGNGNAEGNGEAAIKLPSYSPRIVREIIEDAIARRKPILIEYEPTYGTHASVRRVNPVALDLASPAPSLSGYCHVHGGPRAFKLSRIKGIRVLEDESF